MKICVVTSTRADYGLLCPLIRKMTADKEINLKVVVTGTHLSKKFGYTITEIENDGILIDDKIDILSDYDSENSVSGAMGSTMTQFGLYFERTKPELLILLGDRYEIFSIAGAATVFKIPIVHLHGGEVTEGAYDEYFRHSITKMSLLHFTSCEEYRKRVIQLGESPNRVFNVGAIGVENILELPLLSKEQLQESINFTLDIPFALVTFHPITLGDKVPEDQIKELISALDEFTEMKFIITMANADHGGEKINEILKDYVSRNSERAKLYPNLGYLRYLSAMKYTRCVVGNSSSGILEAPTFKIPTVNIGSRQKGRVRAESVIDCACNKEQIVNAIHKAVSEEFYSSLDEMKNPFGDGDVSNKIIMEIKKYYRSNSLMTTKSFYDL